jgi:hypothetical protein
VTTAEYYEYVYDYHTLPYILAKLCHHHIFGKVWQLYESITYGLAVWLTVVMVKNQTPTRKIVAQLKFSV